MTKQKHKRGEVAQRVYTILRYNPDITSKDVSALMPDVNEHTVHTNISRMYQNGTLATRGFKAEVGPNGFSRTHKTYYVKYARKPKPEVKVVPKVVPKVEAPKPDETVIELIKGWAEEYPVTKPEVADIQPEVVVMRHLADIYKALQTLTEQQDILVQILKGTLADLAETKDELEAARKARDEIEAAQKAPTLWGVVKGWFA